MDDVIAGVEKTLELLELCHAHPASSLEQLATTFEWETGLKRSSEWKLTRIADMLRSMEVAGIGLPEAIHSLVESKGVARFKFNKSNFAVAPQRIEKSNRDGAN